MKTWIKKVFGFGLASFLSDFSHEMTLSFIPIIITQLVGPLQAPSILGVIASLTDAVASLIKLFTGYITDKLSQKKPLIALGYALSAVFSMLMGFAASIPQVLICRLFSFTGSSLREPPRDALIAASVEPQYYARSFGLKSSMDTLGALIGPLVAFALADKVSMHTIFIFSFIPGILAVFAIVFLTQEVKTHQETMFQKLSFDRHSFNVLPTSFIIFVGILFIFEIGTFNKLLLIARAQQILTIEKHSLTYFIVLLYACFNFARSAAEFVIGILGDYFNKIVLLAFFACGLFALTAFMLMKPQASFVYCFIVFILSGISIATLTPLKKACAAHMLPVEIRGFGFGILQASEGFALIIANTLIGYLWTTISASFAFTYSIIVSLGAMLLLLLFAFNYNKQKQ